MRYINLLVALVLSFALIGTAACTSTDDDLSGSAVGTEDDGSIGGDDKGGGDAGAGGVNDPGDDARGGENAGPGDDAGGEDNAGGDQNAGGDDSGLRGEDPPNADEALTRRGDTEKVARDTLLEDCGRNQQCIDDVSDFSAWVEENLDDLDSCFASFNDDLSPQQIRSGQIKSTHCSVETVQRARVKYQDSAGDDNAGDEAGDDNAGDEAGDDNAGDEEAGDDNAVDEGSDDNAGDDEGGDDNAGDDEGGDDNAGDKGEETP